MMPDLNKGSLLAIKLNFNDPTLISVRTEFDTLEVIVTEYVSVKLNANQTIYLSIDQKASS